MSTHDSPNSVGPTPEATCCAGDALHRAKAELEKKAHEIYERYRCQAAEQVEAVRQKTVGEVIDGTVEFARQHPAVSVLTAVSAGFFLGRLLARLQSPPARERE